MKLLFIDGTEGFSPDRIANKPTGGILNSLTIIPQYLAKKGHDVIVKCSIEKEETVNNVRYVPISDKKKLPKWDVAVFNRNSINIPDVIYTKSIGAKSVWWLHDIVDFRYLQDNAYQHINKIIALSQYCKDTYSDFYEIPEDKFAIIPNGVDKKIFYPGDYSKRTKYKMIMASAPIKGYLPVDQTWRDVKRQFPSAELYIYSNQSLHEKKNSSNMDYFLRDMEENKARILQPVKQEILAEIMRSSWALLMPNSYPEICSNLLLQARACGLPVITTDIGSSREFIESGVNGIVTRGYPHDVWNWVKNYSKSTVELFKDDKLHKNISDNAPIDILNWEQVGEMWNNELEKLCSKE